MSKTSPTQLARTIRHCRYGAVDEDNNEPQQILYDVKLTTLAEVGGVLAKADYETWLEGLGMPTTPASIKIWHEMGRFLLALEGVSDGDQGKAG